LTILAAELSRHDRAALAKLASGYQLVPPGATVIHVEPSQAGPRREGALKAAIAECASLSETFADELHADYNRRSDVQRVWTCPACAQVARVRRAPVVVINPYGHHPEQPQESYG